MIEETLSILSDELRIEGRFGYGAALDVHHAAVLICPPHPFLGGDMDNNVVTALYRTLVAAGLTVLRFNYRGIGASETARDLRADQAAFWRDSLCPDYEAEIHRDCEAAYHALRREVGDVPIHVIGYSFGCLPALAICRTAPVERLLLISPPLGKWPIEEPLPPTLAARALFFAPGDFACPEALVRALFACLPAPKELRAFTDADHFFVGHEDSLAAAARHFLVAT